MERLKLLRDAHSITQLKLGIDLNIAQETISGYEIGRAQPNLETLVKLADKFGTSTDYLLGRTDYILPLIMKRTDLTESELDILLILNQIPIERKQSIFIIIKDIVKALV